MDGTVTFGAISVDALALHLVCEPREPWQRRRERQDEKTWVVRGGCLPLPAAGAATSVGRPGMVGVVSLHRRRWLWEVLDSGYMLRSFEIGSAGDVTLGPVLRGDTMAAVVNRARPVEGLQASASTGYDALAVFGLAAVLEQQDRLRKPDLHFKEPKAASYGPARCGTCCLPFADDDCGQFIGVARVCRLCVNFHARRAALARAAMAGAAAAAAVARAAAARDATRAATERAAPPVPPSAPELMLLLDPRALGKSLAKHLVCDACQGAVMYTTTRLEKRRAGVTLIFQCCGNPQHPHKHISTPFVDQPNKVVTAEKLLLGLFLAGMTVQQLTTALSVVGCQLPVSNSTLYQLAQPALLRQIADVRNRELDHEVKAAAATGAALDIGVDCTWSHCREAGEATVVVVNATTRKVMEAQHTMVRQKPSRTILAQLAGDPRVGLPRCSPKALEGLGAEMCGKRLHAAGVLVRGVSKDDDSTSLAAIRVHYPDAQEFLDLNHFKNALTKAVKAAISEKVDGLAGRTEHIVGHLVRLLRTCRTRPALFVPLMDAFVPHLCGDHTQCPTAGTCIVGGIFEGCTFHCILSCACAKCAPKCASRTAEVAAHPRVARHGLLKKEVRDLRDVAHGTYAQRANHWARVRTRLGRPQAAQWLTLKLENIKKDANLHLHTYSTSVLESINSFIHRHSPKLRDLKVSYVGRADTALLVFAVGVKVT